MESYIDCKKRTYSSILDYLENSKETRGQYFDKLCEDIRNSHFEGDRRNDTISNNNQKY